jgi:hypothetical protein
MQRVAIIQPGYLPWLGFFELMASSNIFVIYDDVQFDKHGWRNRNRIKTLQGKQWLTIPVLTRGQNWPKNNEVVVGGNKWKKKHLKSIQQNYNKSKYFDEVFPIIKNGLQLDADRLIDFDMFFICEVARYLNIDTEIVLSSSLNINGEERFVRLANICKHFNATHYYNGAAGQMLYKKEDFLEHGLILEFQNYKHPQYTQLHRGFIPYLSIIDLLFNVGHSSLEILLSGRSVI